MRLIPITQAEAKKFIWKHHRHNSPSLIAIFCVGIESDAALVGVAMAGIPKARMLMDGFTLEVTRVATMEGVKNANSMLYGACARAAAALGYRRLVTYTLPTESGISLRASGWTQDPVLAGGNVDNWTKRHSRHARDLFGNTHIPDGPKIRWWRQVS